MERQYKFNVEIELTKQQVEDLLICGFEGGANYWYDELEPLNRGAEGSSASERFYNDIMTYGFSIVDKETGKKHSAAPTDFHAALKLMYNKYPSHFNDIRTENTDASTGDVFLQLLLFKDVIYG